MLSAAEKKSAQVYRWLLAYIDENKDCPRKMHSAESWASAGKRFELPLTDW